MPIQALQKKSEKNLQLFFMHRAHGEYEKTEKKKHCENGMKMMKTKIISQNWIESE